MFERRQRATEALNFTQVKRRLEAHEAVPPLPGLAAQLMACHAEIKRRQRADQIEACDELDLGRDADADDDL